MVEFIYADAIALESSLRGGRPAEQTLRQAIEFLNFVEQNPYPSAKITLKAETIEINLLLMDARQCRVLAERLLASITSNDCPTADSVTVARAMKFTYKLLGLIEWYNGAVASHWQGHEAATELAERRKKLSIEQAGRAAGNATLSDEEKRWVISALNKEINRNPSKSAAAKKISTKLMLGKFPKIDRSVDLSSETLRKYL